jgi:hypothetical protein
MVVPADRTGKLAGNQTRMGDFLRPTIFLRVASVLTLLYFAGHTSGIPWTPVQGPGEMAVVEAMKSQHFEVVGVTRTFWDFYYGFGVAITGYLLVQAVVLWQLAALAKTQSVSLRPIIASLCVGFLVNAVILWKFFFAIPLVLAIAITVVLGFAFFAADRRPERA